MTKVNERRGQDKLNSCIINEFIKGRIRVTPILDKMSENMLRWFGHVLRRDEADVAQNLYVEDRGKKEKPEKEVECGFRENDWIM